MNWYNGACCSQHYVISGWGDTLLSFRIHLLILHNLQAIYMEQITFGAHACQSLEAIMSLLVWSGSWGSPSIDVTDLYLAVLAAAPLHVRMRHGLVVLCPSGGRSHKC